MTYFNKFIGQRLRTLRQKKGVSDIEAAKGLGVSLELYRQSEMGLRRIPVSEIFAVKKHLKVSIDEFFTYDGYYISDLDKDIAFSDVADLIHYYSNIDDPSKRRSFMDQVKDASSVF